jgi:hypothetical protein
MLSRRELLAASALAVMPGSAFAPQSAAARDEAARTVITLPIEVTHNQLWTSAMLDGKGPYRFAIATGAAFFSLQASTAEQAGLHPAGHRVRLRLQKQGQAHQYWDSYYAEDTVFGGALSQKNLVYEAEPAMGGFFQGVAPGAIFLTTPSTIDFAERRIELYLEGRPDTTGFDRLEMTPLEAANLEILRELDGAEAALIIDVEWNGHPLKVQVATGAAPAMFLYAHAVDRLGVWDKFDKWAAANGRWGYSTTYWRKLVRLPYNARSVRSGPLRIGSTILNNPVVTMVDPTETDHQGVLWWAGNRRLQVDGYIGMETLRRFGLIIDAKARALWVKPNAAVNQPFRYNRSGLRFKIEDERVTISSVKPESPAATAGVQAGDLVFAPGGSQAPPNFGWALDDIPGAVVEFDVVRGGARQPIRMVLRELI